MVTKYEVDHAIVDLYSTRAKMASEVALLLEAPMVDLWPGQLLNTNR